MRSVDTLLIVWVCGRVCIRREGWGIRVCVRACMHVVDTQRWCALESLFVSRLCESRKSAHALSVYPSLCLTLLVYLSIFLSRCLALCVSTLCSLTLCVIVWEGICRERGYSCVRVHICVCARVLERACTSMHMRVCVEYIYVSTCIMCTYILICRCMYLRKLHAYVCIYTCILLHT